MFELPRTFWHLPAAELLQQLNTTSRGLTNTEARQRLSRFGANALKPRRRATTLTLFLAQFKSPIILLLLVAVGLSFFLHDQADAIIILIIILISAGLGFWQEYGAANAVARLLAMVQSKTTVLRDEALLQRVAQVDIFAEVEPNQKERIILFTWWAIWAMGSMTPRLYMPRMSVFPSMRQWM